MPINLMSLVRDSFVRPRDAARRLLGLNLSNGTIAESALLLAVVSVLSRYALFGFVQSQSASYVEIIYPPVLVDVATQFAGVYLAVFVTFFLGRVIRSPVAFSDAAAIYIWFNLLMTSASMLMLGSFFVLGALALLVMFALMGWTFWAIAQFWTALLQRENLLLGLALGVLTILITSFIIVVVGGMLGLPMLEIKTNV